MSSQTFPVITDLAQRFAQDSHGGLLQETHQALEERQDVVQKSLAQGLPPDQTHHAKQEEEALKAAERITSIIWHILHIPQGAPS